MKIRREYAMSSKRIKFTLAQEIALVSQVERVCPLCSDPLFDKKKTRSYKNYEIAHIYPLNPLPEEKELLENEERLSKEVNHENNVIALCFKCHRKSGVSFFSISRETSAVT